MNEKILSYSDYIDDNRYVQNANGSYLPFFRNMSICPYCKIETKTVYNKNETVIWGDDFFEDPCMDEHWNTSVRECKCGWWDLYEVGNSGRDSVEVSEDIGSNYKIGVLKKFDSINIDLPLEVLESELAKNENILHSIHYKKMEQLVESVFKEHYGNCESKLVGKSNDGGIDVIIVIKDKPIAIQVKRRIRIGKTEAVSSIREFLGAVIIHPDKFDRCIYVTNAEKFSNKGKEAAEVAVKKGLVNEFQLVNKSMLIELIKQNRTFEKPWKKHLPNFK